MKLLENGTLVLGRYRVVQKIGQGGMGAVYEAIDERLSKTIALKQTLNSDEHLSRAFEREAKILAGLRHFALPMVTDHFLDDNGQFLVMEFVRGDDLGKLIEQRMSPFPVDTVLDWADQVLSALEYLHSRTPAVIHRDIKPQNIKLTPEGQIMLLDFGMAKGTSALQSHVSAMKSLVGYTPRYAPLEQIEGTGTEPRSDLYSLAATLHHLLSATVPEGVLTRTTHMMSDQGDPLHPVHELNPEVPVAVSMVLQQALNLSLHKRPASAAAMRAALKEARSAVSTSGPPSWTGETVVETPSAPLPPPRPPSSILPSSGGYGHEPAQPVQPPPAATPGTAPGTASGIPSGIATPSPSSRKGPPRWLWFSLAGVVVLVLLVASAVGVAMVLNGTSGDEDGEDEVIASGVETRVPTEEPTPTPTPTPVPTSTPTPTPTPLPTPTPTPVPVVVDAVEPATINVYEQPFNVTLSGSNLEHATRVLLRPVNGERQEIPVSYRIQEGSKLLLSPVDTVPMFEGTTDYEVVVNEQVVGKVAFQGYLRRVEVKGVFEEYRNRNWNLFLSADGVFGAYLWAEAGQETKLEASKGKVLISNGDLLDIVDEGVEGVYRVRVQTNALDPEDPRVLGAVGWVTRWLVDNEGVPPAPTATPVPPVVYPTARPVQRSNPPSSDPPPSSKPGRGDIIN